MLIVRSAHSFSGATQYHNPRPTSIELVTTVQSLPNRSPTHRVILTHPMNPPLESQMSDSMEEPLPEILTFDPLSVMP